MIKVDGNTSLTELAVLRGKLGVERMLVDYDYTNEKTTVCVVLHAGETRVLGRGDSEPEAVDDAFVRLWHLKHKAFLATLEEPKAA